MLSVFYGFYYWSDNLSYFSSSPWESVYGFFAALFLLLGDFYLFVLGWRLICASSLLFADYLCKLLVTKDKLLWLKLPNSNCLFYNEFILVGSTLLFDVSNSGFGGYKEALLDFPRLGNLLEDILL